jgi:hypothetical protein
MAFSDPQTITINAVAQVLARTDQDPQGIFVTSDALIKETIGQQVTGSGNTSRNRRLLRLDHSKIAANPFDSTLNARYNMSVYVVVDVPAVGYTVAEQKLVTDGFFAYLTASSGAKMTQLLGGEK